MASTQKLLGESVGIQFTGTRDETGTNPILGLTDGLIVGQFRRGRTDKPMRITQQNIRAELGYEPNNKFYQSVQAALDQFPFVWVLRVGSGEVIPPSGISCEGATDELHLVTTTWGGADYLYWEFKILDLDTDEVLTEFTNLDFGDTDDFTILCNRFNIPDSPLIFTFDEPTAATIIKNVSTSNRKFKLIGIKLVEDDVDFGIEIYPVGGTPTYLWITEDPPNHSELHACLAPNI